MDAQVGDLVELLAGRRAVLVGHSYGGNVALAAADHHPDLVAGVAAYETPLSWEPWWPGTTAGSIAVAEAGKPREAAERFMRRILGDRPMGGTTRAHQDGPARRGHRRWSKSWPISDGHRPWIAERITVPVITSYGSLGAPHHRRGMQHGAAVLGCRVVELAWLSSRRAAEPSRPVPVGRRRTAAADGSAGRGAERLYGAEMLTSDPRNEQVTSWLPRTPRP